MKIKYFSFSFVCISREFLKYKYNLKKHPVMKVIKTLKRIMSMLYESYSKIEDKVFDILFSELYGIDPDITAHSSESI